MGIKVISGKPAYTKRVLRQYHSMGWAIVRSHKWPDGSESFTLEYVGGKELCAASFMA